MDSDSEDKLTYTEVKMLKKIIQAAQTDGRADALAEAADEIRARDEEIARLRRIIDEQNKVKLKQQLDRCSKHLRDAGAWKRMLQTNVDEMEKKHRQLQMAADHLAGGQGEADHSLNKLRTKKQQLEKALKTMKDDLKGLEDELPVLHRAYCEAPFRQVQPTNDVSWEQHIFAIWRTLQKELNGLPQVERFMKVFAALRPLKP